ncbi:hypothetical protein Tco_0223692 [Tanacetum coccineum]
MTDISKAENCGTTVDYELKNVLSKILIDNFTLRKIVNSVVHFALKVSSSTGKDDAEIPAKNLVFRTKILGDIGRDFAEILILDLAHIVVQVEDS